MVSQFGLTLTMRSLYLHSLKDCRHETGAAVLKQVRPYHQMRPYQIDNVPYLRLEQTEMEVCKLTMTA